MKAIYVTKTNEPEATELCILILWKKKTTTELMQKTVMDHGLPLPEKTAWSKQDIPQYWWTRVMEQKSSWLVILKC